MRGPFVAGRVPVLPAPNQTRLNLETSKGPGFSRHTPATTQIPQTLHQPPAPPRVAPLFFRAILDSSEKGTVPDRVALSLPSPCTILPGVRDIGSALADPLSADRGSIEEDDRFA